LIILKIPFLIMDLFPLFALVLLLFSINVHFALAAFDCESDTSPYAYGCVSHGLVFPRFYTLFVTFDSIYPYSIKTALTLQHDHHAI